MAENEGIFPLFSEDEDDIRERMDADANAGLESSDDRFIDVREGNFYYDVTQPVVIEFGRLWDGMNEAVAASCILTAWGPYLTNHALTLGIERNDAVSATGEVLLSGDEGTLIPLGLTVSAEQTDPDVEAPEYETTESGTISEEVAAPAKPTLTKSAEGGVLASNTYYYKITAINEIGETIASTENSVAVTGPTGKVTVDWADVTGATGYRVYRSTSTGNEIFLIEVVASTYVDTGAVAPTEGVVPPLTNTTGGGLIVAIKAKIPGSAGDVGIGAITEIVTPVSGLETVTNPAAITSGEDIEDDEELRTRCLLRLRGGGAGNIADYEGWALDYPGVGRVTVFAVYNGVPGQVGVSIVDENGDPVDESVVDGLQDELCPLPGQGEGIAPTGDTVIVFTPTAVAIDLTAELTFQDGFSLDGENGTVALRSSLVTAVSDYIDQLQTGEDVVYRHVLAQFFKVRGVLDVPALTIEGGTSDVAISNAQIAQLALPPTLT